MAETKSDLSRYIKKTTIYDYSESAKNKKIQEIKEQFCEKCQKDITLSDEYKKFVSNLDNIHVELKYRSGFRLELYNIDVRASYTISYESTVTTGYSGTTSVNSSGNVETRFSRDTETFKHSDQKSGTYCFYPKKFEVFEVKSYNDFSKTGMVELKESDQMPQSLRDVYRRGVTVSDVESAVNGFAKTFYDEVKAQIKKYSFSSEKISDIRITGAENYNITDMEVLYFPEGFNLKVIYKGKEYKTSKIDAVGARSAKYLEYKNYQATLDWHKKLTSILAITVSVILNLAAGLWTNVYVRNYQYRFMDWQRIVLVVYVALQIFVLYVLNNACSLPSFEDLPIDELKKRAHKKCVVYSTCEILLSIAFVVTPLVMFFLCVVFNFF